MEKIMTFQKLGILYFQLEYWNRIEGEESVNKTRFHCNILVFVSVRM